MLRMFPRPHYKNQHETKFMRKTLRDTIRNILEDELNKHGIKSNELVDKSRVEESVSIRNDEELGRFVKKLIEMAKDRNLRENILSNKYVFHLSNIKNEQSSDKKMDYFESSSNSINFESGMITEKKILDLPDHVEVVRIGKNARLTPLARDTINKLGKTTERG